MTSLPNVPPKRGSVCSNRPLLIAPLLSHQIENPRNFEPDYLARIEADRKERNKLTDLRLICLFGSAEKFFLLSELSKGNEHAGLCEDVTALVFSRCVNLALRALVVSCCVNLPLRDFRQTFTQNPRGDIVRWNWENKKQLKEIIRSNQTFLCKTERKIHSAKKQIRKTGRDACACIRKAVCNFLKIVIACLVLIAVDFCLGFMTMPNKAV